MTINQKHFIKEFDDETIQKLFGYEDAESESAERLREYYFKTDIYKRITGDLPIRILVGHKGTGKSALFKVAIMEEKEKGNLPILIKPDDISELGKSDENFLLKIKQWKFGLTKIIGEKALTELNISDNDAIKKLSQFGTKIINLVYETSKKFQEQFKMEAIQNAAVQNFLRKQKIVVYIDDLDRGWEGKKDDIQRLSALLNAIRDMANDNPGLLFKISLRSDVYYLVRTSDESTDKIEGSVVWLKWTNHEIFVLLIKRILTYFGENINEQKLMESKQIFLRFYLDGIMTEKFEGKGKWADRYTYKVLMSMIRKRPRDLVKLCALAAHQAYDDNSNIIKTKHLSSIFEEYSQGRIQDTINEYKSELPEIESLLYGMKPNQKARKDPQKDNYVYTISELEQKLNNLKQNTHLVFKNGRIASTRDLINFLYKINFITARKVSDDGEIQRIYFEENRYLLSSTVDFGYDWEVHPAFRWALQPNDINGIFNKLELSSDS